MSDHKIEHHENLATLWARAWSTQDTALFLSLFTDDANYCDLALGKSFRGRNGIKTFFEGTFGTFPDFKMEIGRSAVTADIVVGEWVMTGTFLGESFGQAPTGKSLRIEGCCFMHVVGGRIVEHRDYWNSKTFDEQVAL